MPDGAQLPESALWEAIAGACKEMTINPRWERDTDDSEHYTASLPVQDRPGVLTGPLLGRARGSWIETGATTTMATSDVDVVDDFETGSLDSAWRSEFDTSTWRTGGDGGRSGFSVESDTVPEGTHALRGHRNLYNDGTSTILRDDFFVDQDGATIRFYLRLGPLLTSYERANKLLLLKNDYANDGENLKESTVLLLKNKNSNSDTVIGTGKLDTPKLVEIKNINFSDSTIGEVVFDGTVIKTDVSFDTNCNNLGAVQIRQGHYNQPENILLDKITIQRPTEYSAQFSTSPQTAMPGESITFHAGNSTGDIDSYDWTFGDGSSDSGVVVDHSYETTGEYTVELTVSGSDGSDSRTTNIGIVKETDVSFSHQPSTPAAGEAIAFEGTGGTSYDWEFDDGTTATGKQVTHSYETAGTYTVSLTTDTGSATRDVVVGTPELRIKSIDRAAGGVPFKSIPYDETFTATVDAESTVEQVEFELGGDRKVDTSSSDGWSATYDLGTLAETSKLQVTAVDDRGIKAKSERLVSIQPIPNWVQRIIDQGRVTVDESHTRITVDYEPFNLDGYSFDLGSIPIDAAPPQFDGAPKALVKYDAGQQAATVEGDGSFSTDLFGYGFDASMDVQGTVDGDLQLASASGTASITVAVQVGPPLYIDLPDGVPCLGDQVGIETRVAPGLGITGNFDGEFQFQDGTISPSTDIIVDAQLDICGVGAGASVTGGLSGSFDIGTANRNLSGTVSGSGEVWFDVSMFEVTASVSFDENLSSTSSWLDVEATVDDVSYRLTNKTGSNPSPAIPSVEDIGGAAAGTGALASGTHAMANFDRLTNRAYEDTQPSIATTDTETVAVWSRQNESKAVNDGRDIAVKRRSGGSWSSLTYLTDDTRSDENPVIAATSNGELLVAWEYVDTNIDDNTSPADIHPHVEIAYAIYDGSTWSSRTVLTSSSDREFQPAVAPTGDGWLLAWEADADPTTDERDVRHVHIAPDGTTSSISRIQSAAYPSAGKHSSAGGALAYVSRNADTANEAVWKRIDQGTVAASQRFSAGNVTATATGENRVVWQLGPVDNPDLYQGDAAAGTTTKLILRDEVEALAAPTVTTDGGNAVLAYRAYVSDNEARELVYRLDRGTGWIFDRQFVQPPTTDESVWQPATAFQPGGGTFETAFTVSEQTRSGKNDVFVTSRDFLPEYAIKATGPSGVTAGDSVTLDYTIRNRGDVDGTADIELTVENGTGILTSKTLSPLAAGATTSGSVTVTVDETGKFTLTVSTTETTQTTAETTGDFDAGGTTVTVATPSLSVASVATTATDTAAITVRNDGGAAASNIPLAVTDGGTELARTSISSVGVKDTTTTSVTVDPATLDSGSEEQVVLDPDRAHPNSVSDVARTTPTWLLQPDLVATNETRYESTISNGLVAKLLLGNESPVAGETTVRAIVSDGTQVGQTSVVVDGANGGTAYQIVTVSLDTATVNEGDSIEFRADTVVPDADDSTTIINDTVGPVFAESAQLSRQWTTNLDSENRVQHATPAVDSNHVYLGGLGNEFYAFAKIAAQDQTEWVESRAGALSDSSPIVSGGLVFIGSGGGVLYAFDPDASADNRVAWTYEIQSAITSSPTILDGTVYVAANDGTIHAVATDGTVKWDSPVSIGAPVYSALDAANGQVYATTNDGDVVALDVSTGTELWRHATGSELGASGPHVTGGTVYVAGDRVYALDPDDGSEVHTPHAYGGTVGSTPTVVNGVLYVGDAVGTLHALDTASWAELWTYTATAGIASDPAVVDGRVAFASRDGTLYLLDNDTGMEFATRSIGEPVRSSPTMEALDIYLGTEDGSVIDFSLSDTSV